MTAIRLPKRRKWILIVILIEKNQLSKKLFCLQFHLWLHFTLANNIRNKFNMFQASYLFLKLKNGEVSQGFGQLRGIVILECNAELQMMYKIQKKSINVTFFYSVNQHSVIVQLLYSITYTRICFFGGSSSRDNANRWIALISPVWISSLSSNIKLLISGSCPYSYYKEVLS